MIFGIKTRKELKKEIEDLNKKLENAYFGLPRSEVKVVCDTRPIDTIAAVVEISNVAVRNIPDADNYVLDMLQSKISEDLRKYITVQSDFDPMKLGFRIVGTIKVVRPEVKEKK